MSAQKGSWSLCVYIHVCAGELHLPRRKCLPPHWGMQPCRLPSICGQSLRKMPLFRVAVYGSLFFSTLHSLHRFSPPPPTSQVRIPSRQRGILCQLRDHSCSAWHRHGANAPGLTLHVLYPPLLFQIGARESPHPKGEGRPFSEPNPRLLVGGERRSLSARSTGTHDERLVAMGSCFLASNKGGNIASRPELPASSLELPEASSTRELGNFRVTPCLLP